MLESANTLEQVREYYGKTLQTNNDLKTNACCATESLPKHVKEIVSLIDDEVIEKFYGCGSPIPNELAGQTVLDLGCGSGRDVYLLSKLVGSKGKVIGVDMTEEQLEVARRHLDSQAKRFGYSSPNVEFHHGYIEDLRSLGIEDESVDVVVSNCVINLSPDKERVFSEIFRVLKPGGELYFSDVFSMQRVPSTLAADPVLRGECLGGALYIEDFRRMLLDIGCPDYRMLEASKIALGDPELEKLAGFIDFCSFTIRAFKLSSLEDRCEDYGQVATYRGTISESPNEFVLDDHHTFISGKPMLVCGNTAAMVQETRFAAHFDVVGDRSRHFGIFDCSGDEPSFSKDAPVGSCC